MEKTVYPASPAALWVCRIRPSAVDSFGSHMKRVIPELLRVGINGQVGPLLLSLPIEPFLQCAGKQADGVVGHLPAQDVQKILSLLLGGKGAHP